MNEGSDLFQKETTISLPAEGLVRLMVLQQLDVSFKAFRIFLVSKKNSSDFISSKNVLHAHLSSLILLLKGAWIRKNKDNYIETLDLLKEKESFEDVLNKIIDFLDEIQLTRFDTKRSYDRTIVAKANKFHGYV